MERLGIVGDVKAAEERPNFPYAMHVAELEKAIEVALLRMWTTTAVVLIVAWATAHASAPSGRHLTSHSKSEISSWKRSGTAWAGLHSLDNLWSVEQEDKKCHSQTWTDRTRMSARSREKANPRCLQRSRSSGRIEKRETWCITDDGKIRSQSRHHNDVQEKRDFTPLSRLGMACRSNEEPESCGQPVVSRQQFAKVAFHQGIRTKKVCRTIAGFSQRICNPWPSDGNEEWPSHIGAVGKIDARLFATIQQRPWTENCFLPLPKCKFSALNQQVVTPSNSGFVRMKARKHDTCLSAQFQQQRLQTGIKCVRKFSKIRQSSSGASFCLPTRARTVWQRYSANCTKPRELFQREWRKRST